MHQLILTSYFFTFILTIGFSQENKYVNFLKSIDTISKSEIVIKEHIAFENKNKLSKKEQIKFYDYLIPLAIKEQKFDLALKYCFKALNFANTNRIDSLKVMYLNQIGGVYYHIHNKKESLLYFEKAIKKAKKSNNWKLEATISSNLGALSIENRDFDLAEKQLKEALRIFKLHGIEKTKGLLTQRLLATLYEETKQFQKAGVIYIELIDIARKNKDTSILSSSLIYYSNVLAKTSRLKEAIKLSEEALKIQRTQKYKSDLISAIVQLAVKYELNGDFEKSSNLFKEVIDVNHTIFKDELKNSIANSEVVYKTEEIKKEKALAESKTLAEKQKNNIYLLSFSGLILLLIILFLIIYLKQQAKRKKIEFALQKKHLENILEAQEEEKVRLARDLHDGICQKFAATKMKFNAISDELLDSVPELQSNYRNCIILLDEATNELRTIAHEIMPPALSELGLIEAIKQLTEQTFQHQLKYTFEVFGEQKGFSQNEEINLYRITQELCANIIRHAKATEVSIQAVFSKKQFSLFIEDNGIGFISKDKFGMGLSNIKLRAEIIKAKFNIEPGINGGTFVSVINELNEIEQ